MVNALPGAALCIGVHVHVHVFVLCLEQCLGLSEAD